MMLKGKKSKNSSNANDVYKTAMKSVTISTPQFLTLILNSV